MKAKTFLLLLVLLFCLAAVAYFRFGASNGQQRSGEMGRRVFADLDLQHIAAVAIAGAEDRVDLVRGGEGWQVRQRYGYPADFEALTDLVQKIARMKIGHSFAVDDGVRQRIGLFEPSRGDVPAGQRAIRIQLKNAEEKVLADILLGKARRDDAGPGGFYLMRAGGDRVFLVDQVFSFASPQPANWIAREPIRIAPERIRQIVFQPGAKGTGYSLERPDRDQPPKLVAGAGVLKGGKPQAEKMEQVFEALRALHIEDVADPSAIHREAGQEGQAGHFTYRLFDGTEVNVYLEGAVADAKDRFMIRMTAARGATPAAAPSGKASDSSAETEAESLNKRIEPWTFIVAGWRYDRFITDPQRLLETPAEKAKTS